MKTKQKQDKKIEHWEKIRIFLIIFDSIAILASYFGALMLRFDFRYSIIPQRYLSAFMGYAVINILITVIIFSIMKAYRSMWRFASFDELVRISLANLLSLGSHVIGITVLYGRMPVSYFVIGFLLQYGLTVLIRFAYRLYDTFKTKEADFFSRDDEKNAMLIGAGEAGRIILLDTRKPSNPYNVKCIIDDNSNKWGRMLNGVPIVGGRDDILANIKKYNIDSILFAIPSINPKEKRDILNIIKDTSCDIRILPGVYQLVSGEVAVKRMQRVQVEDLLGRDVIKVLDQSDFDYLKNKIILVTGGGGSIGSELCRQIADYGPKLLIIFDIYENNAYAIEQELKRKHPHLNLLTLIGSVRDSRRVEDVFSSYKPDIVYHAAAHKHVPLMETSPAEAIKNNVFGTYKVAAMALKYQSSRFILISTDKAVNPTNIMGASKRLCEIVVQSMSQIKAKDEYQVVRNYSSSTTRLNDDGSLNDIAKAIKTLPSGGLKTEFAAVRFGNVLGSNGSVIPLFKKQIEEGGPVTVTHPDIIRYFMTISEAVSLVLQAGNMARNGEIFVLDMGSPVKIDTLARNLIKLSGLEPDVDIEIKYTGLRPGEKLYEEKLMAEEGIRKTKNELIHIGSPIAVKLEEFFELLDELYLKSHENSKDIVKLIAQAVPSYHSPESDLKLNKEKFYDLYQQMVSHESEDTDK